MPFSAPAPKASRSPTASCCRTRWWPGRRRPKACRSARPGGGAGIADAAGTRAGRAAGAAGGGRRGRACGAAAHHAAAHIGAVALVAWLRPALGRLALAAAATAGAALAAILVERRADLGVAPDRLAEVDVLRRGRGAGDGAGAAADRRPGQRADRPAEGTDAGPGRRARSGAAGGPVRAVGPAGRQRHRQRRSPDQLCESLSRSSCCWRAGAARVAPAPARSSRNVPAPAWLRPRPAAAPRTTVLATQRSARQAVCIAADGSRP